MTVAAHGTMVYAPEVSVHIATANSKIGIVDVSADIVSGRVVRVVNGVSSLQLTLLNQGRKYDGMFTPMDRIVVRMKRLRTVLVFSGYLDAVPVFAAYAGSIAIQASCTLKRLQNFTWDPTSPAAHGLFNEGFDPTNQNLSDGGIAKRTVKLLNQVAGWPKGQIHIGAVPQKWFDTVQDVANKLIEASNTQAQIANIGTDGYLNGTSVVEGAPSQSMAGIGPGTGQIPGPRNGGRCTYFAGRGTSDATGSMALTGESGTNPRDVYYCAMRFPYVNDNRDIPKGMTAAQSAAARKWWMNRKLIVINTSTKKAVCVRAADWGPHPKTGNYVDVSPQMWQALGSPGADDTCRVAFAPEGTKLGPIDLEENASTATGDALKGRGVQVVERWTTRNPRSVAEAIAWAKSQSGRPVAVGTCMHWVGEVYGYGNSGWDSPEAAWKGLHGNTLPDHYKHTDRFPPPGALIWLDSPRNDTGHIVVYLGGGMVASTDFNGTSYQAGVIGIGPYTALERSFGQRYMGWTEPVFTYGGGSHTKLAVAVAGDPGIDVKNPSLADSLFPDVTGIPEQFLPDGVTSDLGDTSAIDMKDVYQSLFNASQWIGSSDFSGQLLSGVRALMNDEPILATVESYMNAGLRHYSSAPNGDFIGWFPDYFGHYGTAAKMVVEDIEIERDFAVAQSDMSLKTHWFVTGATSGSELIGDAAQVYQQLGTAGIASVEMPEVMTALFRTDPKLWEDRGKSFLMRYGARPQSEAMNNITGAAQEFFFACHLFMENWAQQYSATVPLTFMPELYPGMLLVVPRYGIQGYVQEVAHTFDLRNGGGFTTEPTVVAWSTVGKSVISGLPEGAPL